MREIEFRAWDKVSKEWIFTDPNIEHMEGFSLFGEIMLLGEWSNVLNRFILQQNDRKPNDLVVEQYTGLKDKNGKKIFEGDIINVRNWGVSDNEILCVAQVLWDDDDHGWTWRSKAGNYSGTPKFEIDVYDRWRNIEIIGNIHENPNLLNHEQ